MTVAEKQVVAGKGLAWPRLRRGDTEHLARWQLVAFALPNIPLAVLLLPAAVLLPPLYTGELGISLTTWALVVLAARVWDACTDPFVGILSDRLPSRWGRRRHLLVASAPLVMIGSALLFIPTMFTKHVSAAYVLVAMVIMHLGSTIIGLNNAAWGAELSSDYHERTRIMGWRGGIASLAPVAAFGIPAIMEWVHPGVTATEKVAVLGWVSLILLPIALAIAIVSVGEKPQPEAERHRQTVSEMWRSLKALASNRLLLRMLAAQVLFSIPSSLMTSLFVFYVTYVLKMKGVASSLFVISVAGAMCSVPFWMWIAKGREKHRVVATAYLLMTAVEIGYVFLGPGDILPFVIMQFAIGLTGGGGFMMQSIMVDIVDSDTAKSGREQTGAFFAVLETTAKLAPTLAVTFVFPLLQVLGFDPTGKHNTPASVDVVKYCFAFSPTIPGLLACLIMWTFPLGSKGQAELRAKIAARRSAAASD